MNEEKKEAERASKWMEGSWTIDTFKSHSRDNEELDKEASEEEEVRETSKRIEEFREINGDDRADDDLYIILFFILRIFPFLSFSFYVCLLSDFLNISLLLSISLSLSLCLSPHFSIIITKQKEK